METSEKALNNKKDPKPPAVANIFATAIRDIRNQSHSSSAVAAVSVGKSDERMSKSTDGQSRNQAFQSGKDDFHRPDGVRLSGSQASRFKSFVDESGKTGAVVSEISTSNYPAADYPSADKKRETETIQNLTVDSTERVKSHKDVRNAEENGEMKKVTSATGYCSTKTGGRGFHENNRWKKNNPYWDKSMCHNNQQRRNVDKGFQVLRPIRHDNEASKDFVLKNSKDRNQFDRRDCSNQQQQQQQQRPDKDFSTKSRSKQSKKKLSELVTEPLNDKIENRNYNRDQRKSKPAHGDSANWEPRFSKTMNAPFAGKPHRKSCDIPPRRRNNSMASSERSGCSRSSLRNDFKKPNTRQHDWGGSDDAKCSSANMRQRSLPNDASDGGTFQLDQCSQRLGSGSHRQKYIPVSFPSCKKLDSSYLPQHSDTSTVKGESDEIHGDVIQKALVFHNSRMRRQTRTSDANCGKSSFSIDREKEMGGHDWSQSGNSRYHDYRIHGDPSGFHGGGQVANRIGQSGGQWVSRDGKTPVDADYRDMPDSFAADAAAAESMSGLSNEREFVKSRDHLRQQNAGQVEGDKYFECQTHDKTAEKDPVLSSCCGSDRPGEVPSHIEYGFNVVREIIDVDSGERNSQNATGKSVSYSGQPHVYRNLGRGRRGRDSASQVHCDTRSAASVEMPTPESVGAGRNFTRADSCGISTTGSGNVVGRGRGSGRCHAYDGDVTDLCSSYSAIDLTGASRMGVPGGRDSVTSKEIHPRNDLEWVQERSDAGVTDPSYRGHGTQRDLTTRCKRETKTFFSDDDTTAGEKWNLNYYLPPPPPSPSGDDLIVTSFSCGDLESRGEFLYDSKAAKEGTMESVMNSGVTAVSSASMSEATAVSMLPTTAQTTSPHPVHMPLSPQFAVCNAVTTSPGSFQNAYGGAIVQQQCYQDMHNVSASSSSWSGNLEFKSDGQDLPLALSEHESELQGNVRQPDNASDPSSVLRSKIPKDVYQHWMECYFKGRDSNDECAVSWCRHYWYVYEYLPSVPQSSSSVNDDGKNVASNCAISTSENSPLTTTVTCHQVKCGEWKPFSSPVGNFDENFCTKGDPPVKSNFVKELAKNRRSSGSWGSWQRHPSAVSSSNKNYDSRNDPFNVLSKRPSENLCKPNSKLSFDVKSVKKFKTEMVSSLTFPKVPWFEIKQEKAQRVSTELGNFDGGCGGGGEEEKRMTSGFKVSRQLWCPRTSNLGNESASDAESERGDWALKFRQLTQGISTAFIDSHCHLDLLFRRSSHTGSFKDFRESNVATFPPNFAGCVTVFCNPVCWSSYESEDNLFVRLLMEDNVWAAVGCHPKSVLDFNARTEMSMNHLLKHERVKAVGEIGLDFSGRYGMYRDTQIDVLTRQVTTAIRLNKPIVIHARDAENDIGEVLAKIVPREYKIHRHCFLGSWSEAEAWLEKFPRSYIGLTPAVTIFKSRAALRDLLWHLPLNKILLETDAPYFVPSQLFNHEMQLSHPGLAITVAVEIAEVKNISIEAVLKSCLQNTKDMYDL